MPASIAQWGQTSAAAWFTSVASGGTKTITVDSPGGNPLGWTAGDVVTVSCFCADMVGNPTMLPTNPNLTFTQRVAVGTPGSGTEAGYWMFTAKAASTQSNQTITITNGGSQAKVMAACAHVATGVDDFVSGAGNQTEGDFVFTPAAGAIVIYGCTDWAALSANRTMETGTGTATERLDTGNDADYGSMSAEWVGVTNASTSFGQVAYTGQNISHGYVIIGAAAGAVPDQVTGLSGSSSKFGETALSWTAPNDNGSAITDYTVQRAPDVAGSPGTYATVTDGVSTATSTTLTFQPGGLYWYRVAAVNANGTGAFSTGVQILNRGVAVAESSVNTAGTSHLVTLPANIQSTDEVFILMDIGSTAATLNALTGWTEIIDENLANGLKFIRYTGAGVPGNPTFTSSATTRSASIAFRIVGADKTVVPQIGTVATGTSVNPNPPSITPTGGVSKDYLSIAWFGTAGEEADDDTWVTAVPTGYSTPALQKACGTAGTNLGGMIGAAWRLITTGAAVDPATFTKAVSSAWRAQAILVHPASAGNPSEVVDTVVSATTTVADVQRYKENADTTGVTTTQLTETQLYKNTLDHTIAATISVVDGLHYPESADTVFTATTQVDNLQRYKEVVDTLINAVSELLDLQRYKEAADTTINTATEVEDTSRPSDEANTLGTVTTSVVDIQRYVEISETSIGGSTDVLSLLAGKETLDTSIAGTTSLTDIQLFKEVLDTLISSTTPLQDIQRYVETLDTLINAFAIMEDVGLSQENADTSAVVTTSVVDVQRYVQLSENNVSVSADVLSLLRGKETVDTTATTTTSVVDTARFSEVVQTLISAITSLTDVQDYNGEILDTIVNAFALIEDSGVGEELADTGAVAITSVVDIQRYVQVSENIVSAATEVISLLMQKERADTVASVVTEVLDTIRYSELLDVIVQGSTSLSDLYIQIEVVETLITATATFKDGGVRGIWVWTGSSWEEKPLLWHNGIEWVPVEMKL